ncbi:hypothetical protein VV02_03160 [Luteipulveratus mongoliensis]|uniref:Uncharacterized protein n=2 Tax=Luteipulveratus mongoliensis TaxID=571913 RepID=A0A0K1JER6_9MICO|nr:hypothetical protein VV02_03160 [Luteipulveratus mongoliensis]
MIWIGGLQGAGKSTLAREFAYARDLPLHRIDAFTYAHVDRMPAAEPLDAVLARGAEYAADQWAAHCRDRVPLVVADVAARGAGDVPVVVEGPQLQPAASAPTGASVWLLTGSARTRRVREARLEGVDDPDARARIDGLAARELLVAERLRRDLAATGRPSVDVADDPDWSQIRAQLESVLEPALDGVTRLAPGADLAGQRRYENRATAYQLRSHWTAIGAAPSAFEFACECGRSGCDQMWEGTPDEYDAAAESDAVRAAAH